VNNSVIGKSIKPDRLESNCSIFTCKKTIYILLKNVARTCITTLKILSQNIVGEIYGTGCETFLREPKPVLEKMS
jgi:hypothetical protein